MPAKSKQQQKFMGLVRSYQRGEVPPSKVGKSIKKAAASMDKKDVDDYASTKHKGLPKKVKKETKVRSLIRKMVREIMDEMNEGFAGGLNKADRKKFDNHRKKQAEVLGYKLAGTNDVKTEIDDATIKETSKTVTSMSDTSKETADSDVEIEETKKRDYKAEYKKFQSSTKAKKYRAELNKYNRQKGTYGNGDKKDASHKGGKIVGFEEQSKNRGRKEKSRLKKEIKEAITGSDRKIMHMIIRDILENLKKAGAKKPSNQVGRGVLSILRAMTYTPDNANYKNYKKYFPKTFNSKLTQKRVAQFHKQTDKVQLTMVKQAMNKVLGEEKVTEINKSHFMDMVDGEIDSLKGQIAYAQDAMKQKGVEDWEKKEYKAVLKDAQRRLKDKLSHKKRLSKLGEGKLNENPKQIAQTILQQLGGNKFIAMTGAKNLGFEKKGSITSLSFKIGRNSKSINYIRINYISGKDLYEMNFYRLVKGQAKLVKKLKNIYGDQLQKMFTKYTGMNTRL